MPTAIVIEIWRTTETGYGLTGAGMLIVFAFLVLLLWIAIRLSLR